jgi:Protein of unknown function (DUF1569)
MDANLEKLQRALTDATAGMSEEEMSWHPEGKWCAAEVLEHLYLTYTGTVKGFERAIQKGHPQMTPATMRQRVAQLMVVVFGHMPEGRKAPPMATPKGLSQDKVRTAIGAKIGEMDEIISRCESQIGAGKNVMEHLILGPLTAAQWRKFHLVHGLHHVKQIRALRSRQR